MKPIPPAIEQTLTRAELAAPFVVPDVFEALDPGERTRINGAIEGGYFLEIDPMTGREIRREPLFENLSQ